MSRLIGIQIPVVISETAVWLPRRQTKTQRRSIQGLKVDLVTELNFKNIGKRLLAFLIHVFEKRCTQVRKLLIEVNERKSNPEVSSLKLPYYIEGDLNEPPCKSQVSTEEKYQHVQPNLVKKKIPGKKTDDKRTHYAHLLKL